MDFIELVSDDKNANVRKLHKFPHSTTQVIPSLLILNNLISKHKLIGSNKYIQNFWWKIEWKNKTTIETYFLTVFK